MNRKRETTKMEFYGSILKIVFFACKKRWIFTENRKKETVGILVTHNGKGSPGILDTNRTYWTYEEQCKTANKELFVNVDFFCKCMAEQGEKVVCKKAY